MCLILRLDLFCIPTENYYAFSFFNNHEHPSKYNVCSCFSDCINKEINIPISIFTQVSKKSRRHNDEWNSFTANVNSNYQIFQIVLVAYSSLLTSHSVIVLVSSFKGLKGNQICENKINALDVQSPSLWKIVLHASSLVIFPLKVKRN